jgi:hypothetical protein
MKFSPFYEKVSFVLALMVLSFGYGFASHAWEWFPKSYIEQAWRQAEQFRLRNPYLTERFYQRRGRGAIKPEDIGPGLTLLTSFRKDSTEIRLVDAHGKAVHGWPVDRGAIFPEAGLRAGDVESRSIHGAHLLPGGDVVFNIEYAGMVRLNSCGEVVWKVQEGNHHSVSQAGDGSFWTPGASYRPRRRSEQYPNGYPGIEKDVWIEYVLNVGENGSLIKKINVPNLIYKSDVSYKLKETLNNNGSRDITHMNDVEALSSSIADAYPLFKSGDLLVSLLGMNMIFVFHPETGRVKWHETDYMSMQHDPDFIGNGWISVFDNGAEWAGGSRVVWFKPSADSVKVHLSSSELGDFFTGFQGKHQRLANGNVLLTEARRGRVLEVNPDGQAVWEWIKSPLNKDRVAAVTVGTRYSITPSEVASWPCSSVSTTSTSAED